MALVLWGGTSLIGGIQSGKKQHNVNAAIDSLCQQPAHTAVVDCIQETFSLLPSSVPHDVLNSARCSSLQSSEGWVCPYAHSLSWIPSFLLPSPSSLEWPWLAVPPMQVSGAVWTPTTTYPEFHCEEKPENDWKFSNYLASCQNTFAGARWMLSLWCHPVYHRISTVLWLKQCSWCARNPTRNPPS